MNWDNRVMFGISAYIRVEVLSAKYFNTGIVNAMSRCKHLYVVRFTYRRHTVHGCYTNARCEFTTNGSEMHGV